MPIPPFHRLLALATALVCGVLAGLQLRGGIQAVFDTASYHSGAEAVASGRPGTSTLGATFYNFTAAEFLERGGRIPFVDFPLGYPVAAGVLGVLTGTRAAMAILTVAAAALLGALVAIGPRQPATRAGAALRAVVALGIVGLPITRLLTRAVLSETLFAAMVVLLAVSVPRSEGSRLWSGALSGAGAAAGLVRFVGAPLALVPAYVHYRRHGDRRRAAVLAGACLLPVAANVLWAGAAGGGHVSHVHSLTRADLRAALLSVGGWVAEPYGDIGRVFYGGGALPAVWVWVLAGSWVAVGLWTLGRFLRRPDDAPPGVVAMALAAGLALVLVVGMVGFDALVRPDNRVLLPMGVLSLAAAAWALSALRPTWSLGLGAAATAAWLLLAAAPWQWLDDGDADDPAYAADLDGLDAGAFVSNDADGVHWATSTPAVYLPQPANQITDEPLDVDGQYASLPCDLRSGDAIVVFVRGGLLSGDGEARLDRLVDDGRLTLERGRRLSVYRPTATACP